MSIAERLLLIAAGLLLTIPAEARSRCPPGEYWRPTQQGCSSKKDQPQFYTVRGSRFNTKKIATETPQGGEASDRSCPDREAGATFGAEVFWSLILPGLIAPTGSSVTISGCRRGVYRSPHPCARSDARGHWTA